MESQYDATVMVSSKVQVKVIEHEEQRKQVAPGRLLELMVIVPEITSELPEYLVADPSEVAHLTRERVTNARGFFLGTAGTIMAADGGNESKNFFAGGLIGQAPGGRKLAPGDAFAALLEAVAAERFTVAEIEEFGKDRAVLAILRQGAQEHVGASLDRLGQSEGAQAAGTAMTAIAHSRLVPGFDGGGREALGDFLGVACKRATAGQLLTLVSKILEVMS